MPRAGSSAEPDQAKQVVVVLALSAERVGGMLYLNQRSRVLCCSCYPVLTSEMTGREHLVPLGCLGLCQLLGAMICPSPFHNADLVPGNSVCIYTQDHLAGLWITVHQQTFTWQKSHFVPSLPCKLQFSLLILLVIKPLFLCSMVWA